MTPERIRAALDILKHPHKGITGPGDARLIKDFWVNTGCLAKDLIAMSDDELNELWARFVFDRIAEAKEA